MVVQLLLNVRVDSPLVAITGVFCHQGDQCSSSVPVLAEGTCTASISLILCQQVKGWC